MLVIFEEVLLKIVQLLEVLLVSCVVAFDCNFQLVGEDIGEWLEGLLAEPQGIALSISSIFEYFRMGDMLEPTCEIGSMKYILWPIDYWLPHPSNLGTFQQVQAECILFLLQYFYHPSALAVKTKSAL